MYSKVLFHLTRLENAFYRCSLPSYRPAAVFRQYWKSNLYTMLQQGINNAWGNYFFGNCFHCSHTAALQLVHYVNTSEWNVYFWSRLNLYFMLEHGVNDGVISSSKIVFTAQIQLHCSFRNTLTHMYDVYLKSRPSLYTMLEDGVDNARGNYFFRDHHENMPFITEPLKPHFYIVKLGFKGVYIVFLISAQKHRLWVLVRTASKKYEKYQSFLSKYFQFWR